MPLKYLALFLLAATPSMAQEPGARPATLPEAMLVASPETGGWRLSYRNRRSDPATPDREIEIRQRPEGVIVWEIIRTPNNHCHPACPDRLRILVIPKGYVAVPEALHVGEGDTAEFLILPAALG